MSLINRRESVRYPGLFVRKYKKKVFFDNLWNSDPALLEARGHVELADGTVVIRPFTKIFNHTENGTDIDPNEWCLYGRKVNGFMACMTYVPQIDKVVISTTGSLDSDFVALAEKYLTDDIRDKLRAMESNEFDSLNAQLCLRKKTSSYTFMFEIVDPSDPHIVAEKAGAYLLAYRAVNNDRPYYSWSGREIALDRIAQDWGVLRPEWGHAKFSDIVKMAREAKHEGYVVYGQVSNTALKIKSPYYLFLKAAARRKDISSLNRQNVDEEFYPLLDHLEGLGDKFTEMNDQERLDYMKGYFFGS